MRKKEFIKLAQYIRQHNTMVHPPFSTEQLETLAYFCESVSSKFDKERWLSYIAGERGPNGGNVKKSVASKVLACNQSEDKAQ